MLNVIVYLRIVISLLVLRATISTKCMQAQALPARTIAHFVLVLLTLYVQIFPDFKTGNKNSNRNNHV